MNIKFWGEDVHPKKKKFILDNFPHASLYKLEIDLSIFEPLDVDHFIKFAPTGASGYRLSENEKTHFDEDFNTITSDSFIDGLEYAGIRKIEKTPHKKIYPCIKYHENKEKKKICFLDRDGILIKDTGYPHSSDIEYNLLIIKRLEKLKSQGFEFIVITNQSGIARGYFQETDYLQTNNLITNWITKFGIKILDWFYCPYHIEGQAPWNYSSITRKPLPGMILKACEKYPIDLQESIMIGDKKSDNLFIDFKEFFLY